MLASCMTTAEQHFFGGKFIRRAVAPALTGFVTKTAAFGPVSNQTCGIVVLSWGFLRVHRAAIPKRVRRAQGC